MWDSLSQRNDLSFTIGLTLHRLVSQTTRAQQRDRGRGSVSRPQSARPREERLQVGLGLPDIVFFKQILIFHLGKLGEDYHVQLISGSYQVPALKALGYAAPLQGNF